MPDTIITCPNCKTEIPLTDAITQKFREDLRKELEQTAKKKQDELSKKENALKIKEQELDLAKTGMDEQVAEKIRSERQKLEKDIKAKVQADMSVELKSLKEEVDEKDKKLQESKDLELKLRKERRELEDGKKNLETEISRRLDVERQKIEHGVKAKMQAEMSVELKSLQEEVDAKDKKLQEAKDLEIILRRERRELEDGKKNLELEVSRRLDAERQKIEETTAQRILQEHRFKDAEKDKKLEDALKQAEEFKRKLQQGSQQLQGEVLQLELDSLLSSQFPQDKITLVAKGVSGADIHQEVFTQHGRYCGKILWEAKRTKAWQDKWLEKLKNDQREAKADVAAIVSDALPRDVKDFRLLGDIWVIDFRFAAFLATTLRAQVIHLSTYKEALAGKGQKEEALYEYMTGQPYKERMSAMVESCISMQIKLTKERAVAERNFSERESDIRKALTNMAGLHGDLASVVGAALPQVKNLELAYEAPKDETVTFEPEAKPDDEIPF